jgi:predicted nucleic acid-binding protein
MIGVVVADIALHHHRVLVTRDSEFTKTPGLALETY